MKAIIIIWFSNQIFDLLWVVNFYDNMISLCKQEFCFYSYVKYNENAYYDEINK